MDDCAFGGDAGAGAALAEHQGDSLAGQRALEVLREGGAGFEGMFVGGGVADEGCEFGGGQVGRGEEMARREGGDWCGCGGLGGVAAEGVAGGGRPVAGGGHAERRWHDWERIGADKGGDAWNWRGGNGSFGEMTQYTLGMPSREGCCWGLGGLHGWADYGG